MVKGAKDNEKEAKDNEQASRIHGSTPWEEEQEQEQHDDNDLLEAKVG